MNQKGFAVTSVLYGLAILGMMVIVILMGTLSSSRNNVNEEAKSTEDMLLSYGESQVTFHYNSGKTTQEYTVPENGWYRIEAFGSGTSSNRGNYATGVINLKKGNILYLKIPSNDDTVVSVKEKSSDSTSTPIIQVGKSSSSLRGYPNSSSSSLDYPFVDCLKISKVHDGTGKVIIQKVGDQLQRKNTLLDDVHSISITGGGTIYYSYDEGKYVKSCPGICSPNKNLDDLVVFPSSSTVTITVNDTIIYQSKSTTSEPPYGITPEDPSYGIHFSAYQPDWALNVSDPRNFINKIIGCTNNFPKHGTYYLLPVTSKNMAISGYSNPNDDSNPLKIEYLTGEERQKWTIDVINIPSGCSDDPDDDGFSAYSSVSAKTGISRKEYRIVNTASYKALQILQDENYPDREVVANLNFNTQARNEPQIWYIMPLNDGTFAIKTVVDSAWKSLNRSGFLYGNGSTIKIGVAQNNTIGSDREALPKKDQRFYLYSLY